jgi:glycosyltransferase involved in cell wall biosynthesis
VKLSILIPCFNERTTLPEVLARIHACAFQNAEIILVDDGSSDGSADLIKASLHRLVDIPFDIK